MAWPCPPAGEPAYVQSHAGCETLTDDGLTKYIQNDANMGLKSLVEKQTVFR